MSTTSLLVVPPAAAAQALHPGAHHQDNTTTIVDPASFATSSDHFLAGFTSVSVLIPASSNVLNSLSAVKLCRIASMQKLTFRLQYAVASYEETRRAWTCIIGVLAALKGFSPKAPIRVFVEDAVPLAILRASFSLYAEDLNGLRRFLFGADKKLVALIDVRILGSVSFTFPPPFLRYALEEDEVRLKSLFPALRDFGMLLSP